MRKDFVVSMKTIIATASLCYITSTSLHAQDPVLKNAVPLNLPGSFMPNTLPPEPPPTTAEPRLRHAWTKLSNMKLITPQLKQRPNTFNAPALHTRAGNFGSSSTFAGSASNVSADEVPNWSGVAINGSANQYGNTTIAMSFTVPSVKQAFGNCSNTGTTELVTWVGIDGFNGATVEQGGVWILVNNCSVEPISAFIEAYPGPMTLIQNFPIAEGDMIDVWVWVVQKTQVVCGVWENESQNVATSGCLTAPGAFAAESIEWIVERPTSGTGLATLANYVSWPIWSAWSWDSTKGIFWGAGAATPQDMVPPQTGQFYYISMTDSAGNVISYPNSFWPSALVLYDDGEAYCAQGASCQPRY